MILIKVSIKEGVYKTYVTEPHQSHRAKIPSAPWFWRRLYIKLAFKKETCSLQFQHKVVIPLEIKSKSSKRQRTMPSKINEDHPKHPSNMKITHGAVKPSVLSSNSDRMKQRFLALQLENEQNQKKGFFTIGQKKRTKGKHTSNGISIALIIQISNNSLLLSFHHHQKREKREKRKSKNPQKKPKKNNSDTKKKTWMQKTAQCYPLATDSKKWSCWTC